MKPTITVAELERRRKRAVQAVREGQKAATVAEVFGVDRGSVYRWLRQVRTPGGLDAEPLRRQPGLSDARLQRLQRLLLQGASRHGWPDDLWTAARVRQVIRRHFGITYHPEHVRKVLRRRPGWTGQKPQLQAKERDEGAIRRWEQGVFPRLLLLLC